MYYLEDNILTVYDKWRDIDGALYITYQEQQAF
jgi:hypothetical protein